jgi:tetratricopeptide (TPR) repeat protein
MMLYKCLLGFFLAGLAVLFFNSCKTADGKLTKLGKGYHHLTGRYNAYYHAQLKLIKAQQTIDAQFKDDYTRLLPLFPHAANQDSNLVKSDVDEAIKKCAMNIELHRPSNWADDSYFLLGQAEFLRCKREKSGQTFAYIVAKYNPNKEKSAMNKEEIAKNKKQLEREKKNAAKAKKNAAAKAKKDKEKAKKEKAQAKKDKAKGKKTVPNTNLSANNNPPTPLPEPNIDTNNQEKPKKYFLKHRPIHYEAMLWLAKSYIETKEYDDAGLYLRLLAEDGRVPYKLRPQVQAVMAHLFIQQENYPKAIEALQKAIKKTRNRKTKTRYTFVLGQLYEKQQNYAAAFEQYRKIRKLAPTYEMEFNAQLNAAAAAARGGSSEYNHQFALRRMLNDGKNEEFKDQILFAMAQNQLRDGDKAAGMASLRQAMASSGGAQKTEISLLLADLYYEQDDLVNAFIYYDTTCQTLDKKDERYSLAYNRRQQLELYATNSIALARQDTLLAIGAMSFEEQKAFIQRLRKEEMEAKKAPKNNGKNAAPAPTSGRLTLAELAKSSTVAQANPNGSGANKGTSSGQPTANDNALALSTFPLYNPAMQKKGEKDFEKRYGQRAWADDWNRSRRAGAEVKNTTEVATSDLQPMTEQEVKDMLTRIGVPQDEKQKEALNDKIAISLFNIGIAQKEQLNQPNKAIQTFENLLNRFPKTSKRLETLYMLYNIHTEQKNQAKAEEYKNKIIAEFPHSDIAKSVKNPNFLNDKAQKEQNLNSFYQLTYDLVRRQQWDTAAQKIAEVLTLFGDKHSHRARFALLEAMVVGANKGEKDYITALRAVSTSFPNTNEDKKAKEMVALLSNSNPNNGNNPNPNTNSEPSKFTVNSATTHSVIVAFADKKTVINPFQTAISTYNANNYADLKLTMMGTIVEPNAGKIQTIAVRKFKNQDEAQRYAAAVRADKKYLGDNPPIHEIYIISQDNYRILLSTTTAGIWQQYVEFHAANYNK